jgi:gas vesicle protein
MKITSFITGLGVGTAVALLFAPKSGKEMREVVCERAENGRRYAKGRLRDLRNVANDVVDRGRKAVNHQKHVLTAAAQVAKDAYHRESQMRVS